MTGEVERTRATYDSVSAEYHQRTQSLWPALIPHLDRFAAGLGAGARVVDVGCGPGRDTRALRERGLTVFGFDLSIGQLTVDGLAGVAVADMRTLPINTGAVDGLWCQAAFLHVPRDDAPRTLVEFHRSLRPGGALFLCTAEGDKEGWETKRYGEDHPRWFVYHRAPALATMLERTGFDVVASTIEDTERRWVTTHARRRNN